MPLPDFIKKKQEAAKAKKEGKKGKKKEGTGEVPPIMKKGKSKSGGSKGGCAYESTTSHAIVSKNDSPKGIVEALLA